jgi:Flp pilus assembly protein TadD
MSQFACQLLRGLGPVCLPLLLSVLSACASITAPADPLTQLCQQSDLSSASQRLVLAGGYHALARANFACAERLSLEARSKDRQDPYAALNLGALYQRTGRPDQARLEYDAVLLLDSSDPSKSIELAHVATREQLRSRRPSEIARHNLALMQR